MKRKKGRGASASEKVRAAEKEVAAVRKAAGELLDRAEARTLQEQAKNTQLNRAIDVALSHLVRVGSAPGLHVHEATLALLFNQTKGGSR